MGASQGTSSPKWKHRVWGFWLGAAVIAVALFTMMAPLMFGAETDEFAGPVAMLVIVAVGHAAALALTIKRRSRPLGQGMLLGLTLMFPVAWAVGLAANLGLFGWW